MAALRTSSLIAATALALLIGLVPASAHAALKKVRILVNTQVLNIAYPVLNLPVALGYWRDEGYDVDVIALAPPAQSIALLIAGQTDFAQLNASAVVQAQSLNQQPVKIVMDNGVIDWTVGVVPDSPFRSVEDLKGKTIGVFSLASGGVAILRSYLKEKGIDPDRDLQIIATGSGAPAIDALKTGRVQGLLFWASAMVSMENAGLKMRYLRGESWRRLPDFSIATMSRTAESDPRMVEAIARGMAKATVFAIANPECVRRIQWKRFPYTKPTGTSDQALLAKWDENILRAQLDSFQEAYKLNGGQYYGNLSAAAADDLIAFMLKSGQIKRPLTASAIRMTDSDFARKANAFDVEAVRASALRCDGW